VVAAADAAAWVRVAEKKIFTEEREKWCNNHV
jgi:hypothetical protein